MRYAVSGSTRLPRGLPLRRKSFSTTLTPSSMRYVVLLEVGMDSELTVDLRASPRRSGASQNWIETPAISVSAEVAGVELLDCARGFDDDRAFRAAERAPDGELRVVDLVGSDPFAGTKDSSVHEKIDCLL